MVLRCSGADRQLFISRTCKNCDASAVRAPAACQRGPEVLPSIEFRDTPAHELAATLEGDVFLFTHLPYGKHESRAASLLILDRVEGSTVLKCENVYA